MKTVYTATVTAYGGRHGKVQSENREIDLQLSVPKSMGGAGGSGTNPEQLFGAAYAACFGSAAQIVARTKKLPDGPITITAKVTFVKLNGDGYGLAVQLVGSVPNLPVDQVMDLMHAAHEICPYSRAVRGNVQVDLIVDQAPDGPGTHGQGGQHAP